MVEAHGKKFRGSKAFAYAESIGLGSTSYTLHELNEARSYWTGADRVVTVAG
jgi:hypothetical protein